MSLVPVAEFSDRIGADLARLQLLSEGIEAMLFDGGMGGLGLGFLTPVRLMVADEDFDAAQNILAQS
ncbi:putative signal transducing protein [Sphingobium boeckii]|uniref:DUF2007 domain-containing protein n=1 Tax=Sphingobium boeckii TaxID=1082345 RepID=A0A7W9AFN0_9SPHN|nr:DUF2007 domain-containing protein [Sphingobium boeckii]MBB5684579.1 hypothetical protein [Sphingobium boeckii]